MAVRPVTPIVVPVSASVRLLAWSRSSSSRSCVAGSSGPASGVMRTCAPSPASLVPATWALATPSWAAAQATTSPKAWPRSSSGTSRASTTAIIGASRPGPNDSEIRSEARRCVVSVAAVLSLGKAR